MKSMSLSCFFLFIVSLLFIVSSDISNSMLEYLKLILFHLQALLRRTLEDYDRAGYKSLSGSLEIRLIQSQNDIRNPEIVFFAEKYN